jgi:hypothetical protein
MQVIGSQDGLILADLLRPDTCWAGTCRKNAAGKDSQPGYPFGERFRQVKCAKSEVDDAITRTTLNVKSRPKAALQFNLDDRGSGGYQCQL